MDSIIKRIDLFMPPFSRYGVMHEFTQSLARALRRKGVRCHVLEVKKEDPKSFLNALLSDPPECTLSFNGLLPDKECRFLCDFIKIPHVACLLDAPHTFVSLTHSPYSIVACVDRSACDFLQSLHFRQTLFMPHAVDRDQIILKKTVHEERPLDIIMMASFLDFQAIEAKWKASYPSCIADILLQTAEQALIDHQTPYLQLFAQNFQIMLNAHPEIDVRAWNFIDFFDDLDDYINGKDRISLAAALGDRLPLHIYGTESERWKAYRPKGAEWHFHAPVEYHEVPDLMRKAKIVLNSCATLRQGGHERIFMGLAAGALVMTNDTLFLHENRFKDQESLLLYRYHQLSEIAPKIEKYLKNPEARFKIIQQGQSIVQAGHTWDHRAATLLHELVPLLERLKSIN